jgi:putative membrane protein
MLLSEKDKEIIAEAVKRAELTTSGEIVFALTSSSGTYHDATLQGALVGTVLATGICLALPVPQTIGLVLWTEIIAFALFYSLLPHLHLRRWLIPARQLDERVHEAAFHEFYASGLYRTRDSNGVLIYLSLFERRVVVLGDKGIHEKLVDQHWENVRDKIIQGIRHGEARKGICAAVECCGKALAQHFPRRPDDVNELPDEVIDRTQGADNS